MTKVLNYFTEVWQELGKVTWPTRREAIRMTITVLVASAIIGAFIGGLDFILTQFIGRILSL